MKFKFSYNMLGTSVTITIFEVCVCIINLKQRTIKANGSAYGSDLEGIGMPLSLCESFIVLPNSTSFYYCIISLSLTQMMGAIGSTVLPKFREEEQKNRV